eukprot:Protomagalhaensia_wolfi_Nauph_80__5227@NODE_561_length_2289_cov_533_923556_g418_i0_p1_GENE_NODE_561_length_2289_cov_533_923556_g418_i0NODE_561_length_2289_cov_533_923556_g418_i0_p1_ORF_typecomplete_len332_score43_55HOIPUBA/PF16678_5/2_1e06UBA/PF00627_31/5_1e06ubiquitin/PF00240_23/0_00031STI1/PF17830_1/72STI1/PF17830_1/0_069Rad60SLD/PF11976_8/0_029ScsC_N/PF18312_1/39ScsC_N/PF18312_1/4_4e02ScsC_N/PF18312_1/39DUF3410/PF11890_8/0_19HSCB_C/PF07743_13/1_3HSCB_C/PF07743_13/1e02Ubiquitin_5/PF18037_1/0_4
MEDELTLWLQRVPDGSRVSVRVLASASTLELSAQLHCGDHEHCQFIYRGQVIRPGRSLDDYHIQDGDTIFYFIQQTTTNDITTPSSSNRQDQLDNSEPTAASLNSPFLDTIANNPELLMMIMEANPAIRQLKERSPELHALFSDPQTLRDAFQAMRNPSVMREMMRHSDRALSNIDAMPGGFDALRQVYKEVHEPVWESLSEVNTAHSQSSAPAVSYDVHSPESEDPFPQAWPVQPPPPELPPIRMVQETPVFPFAFFNSAVSHFGMSPSFAPPSERYRRQIEDLVAMGFTDRRKCEEALARHEGNLNQAIDDLLRQQSTNSPSHTSHPNN